MTGILAALRAGKFTCYGPAVVDETDLLATPDESDTTPPRGKFLETSRPDRLFLPLPPIFDDDLLLFGFFIDGSQRTTNAGFVVDPKNRYLPLNRRGSHLDLEFDQYEVDDTNNRPPMDRVRSRIIHKMHTMVVNRIAALAEAGDVTREALLLIDGSIEFYTDMIGVARPALSTQTGSSRLKCSRTALRTTPQASTQHAATGSPSMCSRYELQRRPAVTPAGLVISTPSISPNATSRHSSATTRVSAHAYNTTSYLHEWTPAVTASSPIVRVVATENHPTSTGAFRFWLAPDVSLKPFDFVQVLPPENQDTAIGRFYAIID